MLTADELKARFRASGHANYIQKTAKGNDKWIEGRVFSTVLYPENLTDVDASCNSLGVPCSLSPLHDKDIKDTETGEIKKPHYHFIMKYGGKKNPYQVYSDLVNAFGESAFSTLEVVSDLGAMVRYHCHLNNEEKYQYSTEEIKDFNGFTSAKYLILYEGDDVSLKREIKSVIKEKGFIFYSELDDYLEENEPVLYNSWSMNRQVQAQIHNYMKAREHELWYAGKVEKSAFHVEMENGTEKVIFNRQLKEATAKCLIG